VTTGIGGFGRGCRQLLQRDERQPAGQKSKLSRAERLAYPDLATAPFGYPGSSAADHHGVLFPAAGRGGRTNRAATFMRPHTLHKYLRRALEACKLTEMTWYQCTRHTFASQWVARSRKLAVVMQRYAHLRPDLFRDSDLRLLDVDLVAPPADVVELRPSAPDVQLESRSK
jgi:hypothetical protein